jgi:tetratricopeptide (TPR) repeat protein
MDRILALHPDDKPTRILRAFIEVDQRADTRPWRVAIEKILAEDPASAKDPFLTDQRFILALFDRDLDAAGVLAAALSPKNSGGNPELGRDFWMGVVARLKGDETSARAALTRSLAEQKEEIRNPEDVWLLSSLGLIDAILGKKEEALSEGRRAIEMLPIVKNLTTDGYVKRYFAMICAWAGERELALEHLEVVARIPRGPKLWRPALESDVGSFARRSALRKNRRSARPQRHAIELTLKPIARFRGEKGEVAFVSTDESAIRKLDLNALTCRNSYVVGRRTRT